MARNGDAWLSGRVIDSIEVPDPKVIVEGSELVDALAGTRIDRVWRRAKHLLIDVGEFGLAVHFRMTGKLVQLPSEGRIRFVIDAEGNRVGFKDTRRLGSVSVFSIEERDKWLESLSLGPDAYPDARSGSWWAEAFAGCRGAVKPALLDQGRVAGIGNILASEICFRAGLNPATRVPNLDARAWDSIARIAPKFIGEVIDAEMAEEIQYIGEPGASDAGVFHVYGRESEPCTRCGTAILRVKQAQRSTFWCPSCQPAGS